MTKVIFMAIPLIFLSLVSGYSVERGLSADNYSRNRRALDVEPKEFQNDEEEVAEPIKKPLNYDKIVQREKDNEKIVTELNEEIQEPEEKGRGATNDKGKHWNYKMTIIIETTFSDESREIILSAIYTLWDAMKCFDFLVVSKRSQVSSRKDHLVISNKGSGCYSYLGRQKGEQVTVLGEDCNLYGTTMHEIMHVLGFYHEHVRPDRDQYVSINWNTINSEVQRNQYNIRRDQTTFASEYDFDSVMHYPLSPSIQAKSGKIPSGVHPGQRSHLSKRDIQRLQGLYPCSKKP